MTANDGGPAFAVQSYREEAWGSEGGRFPDLDRIVPAQPGMSLRDYFAAAALKGMLGGTPGQHLIPPNAANMAYEYADAMLAERGK